MVKRHAFVKFFVHKTRLLVLVSTTAYLIVHKIIKDVIEFAAQEHPNGNNRKLKLVIRTLSGWYICNGLLRRKLVSPNTPTLSIAAIAGKKPMANWPFWTMNKMPLTSACMQRTILMSVRYLSHASLSLWLLPRVPHHASIEGQHQHNICMQIWKDYEGHRLANVPSSNPTKVSGI